MTEIEGMEKNKQNRASKVIINSWVSEEDKRKARQISLPKNIYQWSIFKFLHLNCYKFHLILWVFEYLSAIIIIQWTIIARTKPTLKTKKGNPSSKAKGESKARKTHHRLTLYKFSNNMPSNLIFTSIPPSSKKCLTNITL